jgi:hypothetical protein
MDYWPLAIPALALVTALIPLVSRLKTEPKSIGTWFLLVLALAMCLAQGAREFGAISERQRVAAEREREAREKLEVRWSAHRDLGDAMRALLDPFVELHMRVYNPPGSDGVLHGPTIEQLKDPAFVRFLETFDVSAAAQHREPLRLWRDEFSAAAIECQKRLDSSVAKYSAHLTPPTIMLVQAVRSHSMMELMARLASDPKYYTTTGAIPRRVQPLDIFAFIHHDRTANGLSSNYQNGVMGQSMVANFLRMALRLAQGIESE